MQHGGDSTAWRNAFGATAAISLIPNLILFAIPTKLLSKDSSSKINYQHVLLCFASGALLGDVVIHSLPHLLAGDHGEHDDHHHDHSKDAHSGHKEDHHDDHSNMIYIGVLILLGFLFFFMTEKFASRHMHSHVHSNSQKNDVAADEANQVKITNIVTKEPSTEMRKRVGKDKNADSILTKDIDDNNGKDKEKMKGSSVVLIDYLPSFSKLSASGWLNLVADSMHNFTDGIALGASFSSASKTKSSYLGVAALFSIMFHEIPHELGDFSILIENGFTKWEAIKAQFITSIAAFVGTFVGLYLQRNENAEKIMLSATSGGFLYIATVGILPTVINKESSILQICFEGMGFLLGVAFMVGVAVLEDHH